MKKYYLSGEDLKRISKILEGSKSIENLYNKLYELELDDKKDTEEYKTQIQYLRYSLDLENRLYQNSNFSADKCSALIKYLIKFKLNKDYIDCEEYIINQDCNNIHILRVLRFLTQQIVNDDGGYKELYLTESDSSIFNMENLTKAKQYTNICNFMENDIHNLFLLFLQELIDNKNYSFYKNEFIRVKYNLSFINSKLEKQMIDNNFNINRDVYLSSKLISDLYGIDLEIYNFMRDDYASAFLDTHISEFLKLGDIDYNERTKSISSMIRSCYIKSYLLMMSDDKIYDCNSEFHEYIESEEYINKHPNDTISEKLIINCFKGVRKDRTKVKRLSFVIK